MVSILSGSSTDFTGRTIWVDVLGIARTERLILTDEPDEYSGATHVLTRGLSGDVVNFPISAITHTLNTDDYTTGVTLSGETLEFTRLSGGTYSVILDSFENSGLERLDEGNGDGWRLIDRDPVYYGNIGETAIDFSLSTVSGSTTMGSTGFGSVTFGLNNMNPYVETLMLGRYIEGSTTNGFSGSNIIVSENFDGTPTNFYNNIYNSMFNVFSSTIGTSGASLGTAVIYESTASGRYIDMYAGQSSAMFGAWLSGGSTCTTIVGISNEDLTTTTATASASSFNTFGPRFIVGVGTNGAAIRRNGFVVMSDGTSFFPYLSIAQINAATGDSAVTKEWVESVTSGFTSTDDYLTGHTFNTTTGLFESNLQGGSTVSVNLDGRYSLTGHTHVIADITDFTDNSTNWNAAYYDSITGMTVTGTTTKTITLFQQDGGLVQASFTDEVGVGAGNDYLTGATFNTTTGDLTLTLFSGSTVIENLDGRYSLTGHTHSGFITGATAPDTSVQFNNGGAFSGTSNFTWDGDVNISSTLSTSSGQFINVEELGFSKSAKVGVNRSLGNPFPGIWFNQSSPDITNYAFLAGATDQTIFNTPSGTDMGYRIGNAQKMIIWSTGGVSIGDAVADQTTGTDPGSDNLLVGGSISATTFVTDGGTTSQFVKGDGSLDSNTYLTSVGDLSGDYLPLSGGTLTGPVTGTTFNVNKSQLDYQENLTVDSGTTETIATVSIVEYKAVFFDYVVSESTNIRAGTVMTTHMGGSTVFTDNSTTDIGDTSDVIFSTDISGSDLRLLATTATDGWEIKVMIRAL